MSALRACCSNVSRPGGSPHWPVRWSEPCGTTLSARLLSGERADRQGNHRRQQSQKRQHIRCRKRRRNGEVEGTVGEEALRPIAVRDAEVVARHASISGG